MATITVPAILGNIPVVTQFIEDNLEQAGCPMKEMMQIEMATDEIFSNISYYAYPKNEPGEATVHVDVDVSSSTVDVTFEDAGIAFNPLDIREPDVSLSVEERSPGGLGIFLVRKVMDALTYERVGNKNVLQIRKKWQPEES